MTTTLYFHDSALKHDTGTGHPERPERYSILKDLFSEPSFNALPQTEAPQAELDQIFRAHDEDYVFKLENIILEYGTAALDSDTIVSPDSWDAALRSAGAACAAVDAVMTGKTNNAFSAMRPPGHHAEPNTAMGFCLFNNAAIAALQARDVHGAQRVVIIDFDVHHGNGTDTIAHKNEGLFYISTHQMPLYPGTGDPTQNVNNSALNIAFEAGDGSDIFRQTYQEDVFPVIHAYKPDLVVISAGFDAHKDDPIGGMNLTEDDYFWVTQGLCAIANEHCDGKIVSVLEGGYNLEALKASTAAHLRALIAH